MNDGTVSVFEACLRYDELNHKALLRVIAMTDIAAFHEALLAVEKQYGNVFLPASERGLVDSGVDQPLRYNVFRTVRLSSGTIMSIWTLLSANNRVGAIKELRSQYLTAVLMGLKEAKDVIDMLDPQRYVYYSELDALNTEQLTALHALIAAPNNLACTTGRWDAKQHSSFIERIVEVKADKDNRG